MNSAQTLLRTVLRNGTISALLVGGIALAHSPDVRPDSKNDDQADSARIQQGFAITPVALNLRKKNRALVGLGSYLVNAAGGCNDCHTAPSYSAGGDPFMGQTEQINVAGYLGGGRVFGPFDLGGGHVFGPFVARNLTPDAAGLPGGAQWSEFDDTMRTGIDPHAAHPQFGPFLQIMAWPVYRNMTQRDMRAVYEYLRAIPCVEGNPGLPPIVDRCN